LSNSRDGYYCGHIALRSSRGCSRRTDTRAVAEVDPLAKLPVHVRSQNGLGIRAVVLDASDTLLVLDHKGACGNAESRSLTFSLRGNCCHVARLQANARSSRCALREAVQAALDLQVASVPAASSGRGRERILGETSLRCPITCGDRLRMSINTFGQNTESIDIV
jgi:hypothetical protein